MKLYKFRLTVTKPDIDVIELCTEDGIGPEEAEGQIKGKLIQTHANLHESKRGIVIDKAELIEVFDIPALPYAQGDSALTYDLLGHKRLARVTIRELKWDTESCGWGGIRLKIAYTLDKDITTYGWRHVSVILSKAKAAKMTPKALQKVFYSDGLFPNKEEAYKFLFRGLA